MRDTFIEILTKEAAINKKIILMVGDLGYSVIEDFQQKFPDRFYNAGISEQNMASMAAGLASDGFHVFIYSIANFPTFRCAEQLRNDVGYHNLPVTVVSVGGGLSYGNLGYSHHAIQDLGLMRLFPEFEIACPGDPYEVEICLKSLIRRPGPSYLRLKKSGEKNFSSKELQITPGYWNKIIPSKNGKTFLTTGGGLQLAINYIANSEAHSEYGIYTCPIWGDKYSVLQQMQINQFNEIVTVEDHLLAGGFGSWLRESVVDIESHIKIKHKALNNLVIGKVGKEDFLYRISGLDQI